MPRRRAAVTPKGPNFPVAYVRYHDHCWLESKELKDIEVARPFVIEETGFLLVENSEYVTLAKERSTDGEKGKTTYGDVTIILRSDILHFEVLGTPTPASRNGKRKTTKAKAKPKAKSGTAKKPGTARATKPAAKARAKTR